MNQINLSFTTLEFYEGYVLSHVKDDVILDHPQVQEMLNVCKNYYNNKPYVYVSLRLKDYTVNPVIYLKLKKLSTLLGIAIVCQATETCRSAEFEKNFSPLPFKIFHEEEEAIDWATKLVRNKKADL